MLKTSWKTFIASTISITLLCCSCSNETSLGNGGSNCKTGLENNQLIIEQENKCNVEFEVETQSGQEIAQVKVCRLKEQGGYLGQDLLVILSIANYGTTLIDKLSNSLGPVMEKVGSQINILYTSGANTTCVKVYEVSGCDLKLIFDETIAWNDSGKYCKSKNFNKFKHLIKTRSTQ